MTEQYIVKFRAFLDPAEAADADRVTALALEGIRESAARAGVNLIGDPWIRWPRNWGTVHDAPEGKVKMVARCYCD